MDEPILKSGQWPNIAIDPRTGRHAATGEAVDAPDRRGATMEHDGEIRKMLSVWFCSECGSPTYNDMMPFYCQYCGVKVRRES